MHLTFTERADSREKLLDAFDLKYTIHPLL